MKPSRLAMLLIGMCLPLSAAAQDVATTAPAIEPSTRPAPKLEQPPPGFVRVAGDKYSAFCQPVDETWVKASLTDIKPTQLPTTRPADILANITKQREAIAKGLSDEVGIDPAKTAAMFDERLIPQLTKLDSLTPPVVFLVATEQKVIAMINGGWTHPRITYNRMMNQIRVDDRILFSIDNPMDESLLVAYYDPTNDVSTRAKKLREAVEKFESETAFSVAARSRVLTQVSIAQVVEKEAFVSMKLRDDQSWLQLGSTAYLAAKYAPLLTGGDPVQMLADLIYESPNTDPKAASVNLMKLPDLNQIVPQYRQPFISAARRKSTMVIQTLATKGGPEAIKKAVAAVRSNPPKDGPAMVSLINSATGVDLSDVLGISK